jgi:subtilisin family serine protease
MILCARGRGARKQVEGWLADAGIETTPWSRRIDPDQISVLAHLPHGPHGRRLTLAALRRIVEKDLPSAGLVGQLAAPMLVDDRIDGLTGQIIVRFAPEIDGARVCAIAKAHKLTRVRAVPYACNCHVLAADGIPTYELVETLAELAATSGVIFAEPDLLTMAVKDGPDFLLPEQKDVSLIGCPGAWAQLPGGAPAGSSDITVAVIDLDGVDPGHPDLSNVIANHDFVARTAQTSSTLGGSHGTQCAATAVGAFGNTVGTAGVAGNCRLIGARISDTSTAMEIADAWVWAAGLPIASTDPLFPARLERGADVISNSWGIPGTLPGILRDAIDFITTYGRGGSGCVMCFSAGNVGDIDFATERPAAGHERAIAVGASTLADARASYSPFGELDLVAPSSTTVGAGLMDPMVSATRVGFGSWTSERTIATTLAVDASPGATEITVANASGFQVSDRILIGVPGHPDREFSAIIGIGSGAAGNVLTLDRSLARAHLALGPGGVPTEVSTGGHDHDQTAGGTSHATALVAGAAALVLSARPDLGWSDVRAILRKSAVRIDAGQSDLQGRWVDRDGDDFSLWYGYGRLDVDEAVRRAKLYPPVPDYTHPPPQIPWSADFPEPGAGLSRCCLGLLGLAIALAIVLGVVVFGPWSSGGAISDPALGSCDLPRRAKPDECPEAGCGGNGKYLSGFAIDGLNVDGCRNYDGVRVVPGSLSRGDSACPGGAMTLDLVDGALIGREVATGAIACAAGAMNGVTFTVEGPAWAIGLGNALDVRTRDLRIRLDEPVATVKPPATQLRTYRFEPAEGGASLCRPASPAVWFPDFTAPVASTPPGTPPPPTPAVLVAGELYDVRDARVLLTGPRARRWFNVACQGGAISKMRLIGLDPMSAWSAADERQATLKMITAKYCGSVGYTTDGVGLLWTSLTGWTEPADPTLTQLGPLEARWTAEGAACLSHSRVARPGVPIPAFDGAPTLLDEPDLLEHVRTACRINDCAEPLGPGAGTGSVYWTTRTVDHIAH